MCIIPGLMPHRPPSPQLAPILAALRGLEPPECSCPIEVVPVCKIAGGCERRKAGRTCSCPRWPGRPCKHILAWMESRPDRFRLASGMLALTRLFGQPGGEPADAWAAALWSLFPRLYSDRPTPSRPARAIDRKSRCKLRELRRSLGLSLWHQADQLQPAEGGADLAAEQQARAAADERRRQRTLEARREREAALQMQRQQEAFLAVIHGRCCK